MRMPLPVPPLANENASALTEGEGSDASVPVNPAVQAQGFWARHHDLIWGKPDDPLLSDWAYWLLGAALVLFGVGR